MGLDNGFIVRGLTKEGKEFLQNRYSKENYDEDFCGYDFGYFRKFWGLRKEIINILPPCPVDEEGDPTGEYVLTTDNIRDILQILKDNLNEDIYEQNNCFWEYHVGIRTIANAIFMLTELLIDIEYEYIKETDVEIMFYDYY